MSDSVAQDQLRAFIERIERMEEEKKAIADEIKEIYAEAKGNGFSVPVLREIIRIRKKDHAERMEQEALLDIYMSALGMQSAPREDDDDQDEVVVRSFTVKVGGKPASAPLQMRDPAAPFIGAIYNTQSPPETTPPDREADHPSGEGDHATGASAASVAPIQESQPGQSVDSAEAAGAATSLAGVEGDVDRHPILPETANETGAADVPTADPQGSEAATHEAAATAAPVPHRPGDTWLETVPPAPVRWHDFARVFTERWAMDLADLQEDIAANGVQHPVIKIGDEILDGRARYNAARTLGIEYPVKEYDGTDPLADVIRWNLASRNLSTNERKAIATKLMKLPAVAHRASEIAGWFGLEMEGAA